MGLLEFAYSRGQDRLRVIGLDNRCLNAMRARVCQGAHHERGLAAAARDHHHLGGQALLVPRREPRLLALIVKVGGSRDSFLVPFDEARPELG
jgi:hypothetical protein